MEVAGESTAASGAIVPSNHPASSIVGFAQTPGGKNFFLMLGVAAVAAVMSVVWMWGQQPDYRVLFSNFSDRDGGAIIASLQQLNVPYKFAEGGNAILVPAAQVHDTRLKLASQGLPKGGNVGFELMETQKLGVSQFLEQVNFQRALEGELARSIQSIAAIQAARVHLALPKASVFVRDQKKPTASVLLNLHPGRSIDPQQVSAIVHLVASSVPELPTKNVTVVDQDGTLLSENNKLTQTTGLDPTQLKYVQELQQSIVKRIESIITPIVGPNNVRAEATADVDFSHSEQAAEVYTPNQGANAAAVRSQQSSESQNSGNVAGGVPGAMTNQPPVPATAPLTAPEVPPGTNAGGAPTSVQKDTTVNYEVDKTVRYVQQPMGGIKRLSVAVVVNYRKAVDNNGETSLKPLTEEEKTQITNLVREAMGFNKDRGDTLNVVNSPFAGAEKELIKESPLWKRPEILELGMALGKYLLIGIVLLYLYFAFLRPLLRKVKDTIDPPRPSLPAPGVQDNEDTVVRLSQDRNELEVKPHNFRNNLEMARQLARDDPRIVATVVKNWVSKE